MQQYQNILKSRIFDTISFGYLIVTLLIICYQPSQEVYLQLGRNTLIVLVGFVFGFSISLGLSHINVISLGQVLFVPSHQQSSLKAWYKTFWGIQLMVLFLTSFLVGSWVTQVSLYELTDPDGLAGAWRILTSLFYPEMSVLPQGVLAILETIYIAFMATVIALPMAFVLSFLCAKNIMHSTHIGFLIYMSLRAFLNVVRSIEPLIWAIIFTVWVGIGPFAGMLGLMLHSVAALAKQFSELIECVEDGPIEGIMATGAKPMQVVWFAIVPQILLPYISFTIYRWDINVRMATLIGLVGGGGIGTMLIQYQGQGLWREVGTLAILIVMAVWSLDIASTYIRQALK